MIIPDIHGQSEKLEELLTHLGWRRTPAGWSSNEPEQEIVFLGDFIDRGPENARVIKTVRSLIDAGKAHAVMGNHELNAIHFHTDHPETGTPLRPHSEKNLRQHASFLSEFAHGSADAADVIAWMRTLPLFREFDALRAVHACWNEDAIATLGGFSDQGRLNEEQFIHAADETHDLFALAETTTKGPEIALPHGYAFSDKDGTVRTNVRVQWWRSDAQSWPDLAMSVPEPDQLPDTALPSDVAASVYPSTAKPVFFGHYWLTGEPALQAANALCLDYSAGKDGPLLAYQVDHGTAHEIDLVNILSASD